MLLVLAMRSIWMLMGKWLVGWSHWVFFQSISNHVQLVNLLLKLGLGKSQIETPNTKCKWQMVVKCCSFLPNMVNFAKFFAIFPGSSRYFAIFTILQQMPHSIFATLLCLYCLENVILNTLVNLARLKFWLQYLSQAMANSTSVQDAR